MEEQELISSQAQSFIKHSIEHLLMSRPFYKKNIERCTITNAENFHSSLSVISSVVFLEGNLNRIAYFQYEKGLIKKYDNMENCGKKIKNIFKSEENLVLECNKFIESVKDVMEMRNSIMHGHIYFEKRKYGNEGSKLWSIELKKTGISPDSKRRGRDGSFKTQERKLPLIPTHISYIEALKAVCLIKELRDAFKRIWPQPMGLSDIRWHIAPINFIKDEIKQELEKEKESIRKMVHMGRFDDWIEYAKLVLRPKDGRNIEKFIKVSKIIFKEESRNN